jgi:hypothetical protein
LQGVIGLIAIIWLVNTPWALALVALLVMVVAGYFAWNFVREIIEAARAPEPMAPFSNIAERHALIRRVADLEGTLRALRAETDTLRTRNEGLQRDLREARSAAQVPRANPLYRRVGLDEEAPEWVVSAVRRAYRAKRHPDATSRDCSMRLSGGSRKLKRV